MKDIEEEIEGIEDIEADEPEHRTFTVAGKSYEVAYSQRRIELYESGHKPIMATFMQNGGAFSVGELKSLLAYGLKYEGAGYVNPKRGEEMASKLIEVNGYLDVFEAVVDALQRDCGFLFAGTGA